MTKVGTGEGTVTSVPAGISCGEECYVITDFDERFTLAATPAPGSVFNRWWGTCQESGSDPTCPLEMTRGMIVVAVLDLEGGPPTQGEPTIPDGPPPPALAPPAPPPTPPSPAPSGCTIVGTSGPDILVGTAGKERATRPPTSCRAGAAETSAASTVGTASPPSSAGSRGLMRITPGPDDAPGAVQDQHVRPRHVALLRAASDRTALLGLERPRRRA